MTSGEVDDEAAADEPLTTKEGWRRFVDRQPTPPDLHNPATVELLTPADRDAYDEARRAYHADLPLANTPTIQRVISTARLLVQLNRNQVSARRGVIVSGASGTGKTTALTQLGRTHERHARKRHPHDKHRGHQTHNPSTTSPTTSAGTLPGWPTRAPQSRPWSPKGYALPLAAILWGFVAGYRRSRLLRGQRHRIAELTEAGVSGDDMTETLHREGIPFTVWPDLLVLRQDIELAILRQLRGPIVLAIVGLLLGAAGDLWALYL